MKSKEAVREVPWARPYFGPEEREEILKAFDSGHLSQGPRVAALEARLKELTGAPHAVAVHSGTAALDIALKLLGVQPGDHVLVPSFAYIASVNCILYQDAVPVFCDVDPVTLNLSVESARSRMTERTKGIIALDYAGQSADWRGLRELARERELFLVEDAAPGLGGAYHGQALSTLGDVAITSFHAAKTFNTVEGGMVFLHDADLERRARIIRSQGESPEEKYVHPELGHNYRMSDLHAAVGLAQFARYEEILRERADAARYYDERLAAVPEVERPVVLPHNRHAWFLYPTRVPRRDLVRERLAERGIGTNVSWPHPAYRQPYLQRFAGEACPVAERACASVLCLPLYMGMTREDQDAVVDGLRDVLGGLRNQ
jgi:perosamine synthetase